MLQTSTISTYTITEQLFCKFIPSVVSFLQSYVSKKKGKSTENAGISPKYVPAGFPLAGGESCWILV